MAAAIGGAMMCRQPRSARKRPLPRLWLMTDERVDDETLLTAIRRLPQGSGIIFRHYTLPTNKRRLLFARVRAIAQRRRLVLLLAGPEEIALAWKADRSEEHTSELQSL